MGVTPRFLPEMSREISTKDLLTIAKLYKLFLREHPDIVHTHTAKAGTVGRIAGLLYRWSTPAVLLGRPRKCRFVHTYHGHIFHSYYGPLRTRSFLLIEKALARLITDRIVVLSQQQLKEIHERFGVGRKDQFLIIPLGLDLKAFGKWQERRAIFRQELGAKSDDVLVGIVGRLSEIKNHELFLQAAALVKQLRMQKPGAQLRFVVIGDGTLRGRLETLAKSLGVAEDLLFAGERRDPENFYPALDIVALTSRNEGTPLTLIEAMANARPIIATAVGGVGDLLGDATSSDQSAPYIIRARGISTPPSDPRAFAAGLVRMLEDPTLCREIGERGLQYVATNYSKDRLLSDIEALYRDLLPKKPTTVRARSSERGLESGV
jgi:glycosyltransferase involved in cell wall biosynthesis